MTSPEILDYFDAMAYRETRDDLKAGIQLVKGPRIAIDCGCGAGSDIAFLRANGFVVHGFDVEAESIARCRERFRGDSHVILSQASFSTFEYPSASLVVADASLFFCPADEFDSFWEKIKNALLPSGVFVGSFLGPEDTMVGPAYDREAFWPDVLVASEERLRSWLDGFEIVSFTGHKKSGLTPSGVPHDWHIFAVVAQKKSKLVSAD